MKPLNIKRMSQAQELAYSLELARLRKEYKIPDHVMGIEVPTILRAQALDHAMKVA